MIIVADMAVTGAATAAAVSGATAAETAAAVSAGAAEAAAINSAAGVALSNAGGLAGWGALTALGAAFPALLIVGGIVAVGGEEISGGLTDNIDLVGQQSFDQADILFDL